MQALGMRTFPAGVQVRRERGLVTIADPLRHPATIADSLRSGLITPRALAGFARWIVLTILDPRRAVRGTDRAVRDGWDRAGLVGPLRHEVLEPFLAGVIADTRFDTSDAFVRILVRLFIIGSPGLPERGIQALPRQLAALAQALSVDIRLDQAARRIHASAGTISVDVTDGDALRARAVVVAVGPEAAAGLTGVAEPRTRGLQTWWFRTDVPPTTSGMLTVDGAAMDRS